MIEVRGLGKTFPALQDRPALAALADFTLQVRAQEFVCLLGPSGCGKTTLLRILAGLLPWERGEVLIDGRPVAGPGPDRAMVFQHYALLPWADVLTNVAFGLDLRRKSPEEKWQTARRWIEAVGLSGFERHYPRELSGGMQQRVGLARALAVEPSILLMDEPFGSVDAQTRRVLQEDLVRLQQSNPRTVVFVTHSMEESVRLGDRVVLVSPRPGRVVESIDVPFPHPRSEEVRVDKAFVELKEYLWGRLQGMQPRSD
jgi:ABC-type nitrate/sulfonate/bicarbonate transport system ATPase subunit